MCSQRTITLATGIPSAWSMWVYGGYIYLSCYTDRGVLDVLTSFWVNGLRFMVDRLNFKTRSLLELITRRITPHNLT